MRRPVVLVIRPDDKFSRLLRKGGLEVVNLELIRTEPTSDLNAFREIVRRLDGYDGIFITSPVSAEIFAKQLDREDKTYLGKVYVLGDRARDVLGPIGLDLALSGAANTAEEMVESFGEREFAGKQLLFIRGDHSTGTIPRMLGGKARVDEIIVYRTLDIEPDTMLAGEIGRRIDRGDITQVCFFSPSGVSGFVRVFGPGPHQKMAASAIGETTAAAAREAGMTVHFVSQRATAEEFAAGFVAYIKSIG